MKSVRALAWGILMLLAQRARGGAVAKSVGTSNSTKSVGTGAAAEPPDMLPDYPEEFPEPTNQPATRGQDEQKCGYFLLPDRVTLSSDVPDWFGLSWSGKWTSIDGGTFAKWYQNFFRWIQPTFSVFVDSKLVFRMESLGDGGRHAPGEELSYRKSAGGGGQKVHALTDCQNDVMYVVSSSSDCTHTIYDRFGNLVGQSRRPDHPMFKDSVLFEDENDKPIAVAMSPMIIDTKMYSYGMPEPNRQWEAGRPNNWQIWYFTGKTSERGLRIAQNRWVIAAAIQQCALEEALRGVSEEHLSGILWIVGFCVRVFYVVSPLLLLALLLYLCHSWFFTGTRKPKRNVFFRDDDAAPGYGAMAEADGEPSARSALERKPTLPPTAVP